MHTPFSASSLRCGLDFVWRQLESAFFGALTLVGALFVFKVGQKVLKSSLNKVKRRIN